MLVMDTLSRTMSLIFIGLKKKTTLYAGKNTTSLRVILTGHPNFLQNLEPLLLITFASPVGSRSSCPDS